MNGKIPIWKSSGNGSGIVMHIGDSVGIIASIVGRLPPMSILGSMHWIEWHWAFVFEEIIENFGREPCPMTRLRGEHTIRFAQFSRFLMNLADLEKQARGSQSLLSWSSWLTRLSNEFFPQSDATLLDRRKIDEAVESLSSEYHKLAGGGVPLRVIRYHLGNVLEIGSPQGRFLTQGVTFSGLRPIAVSVPAICIMGLNADAFPRQNRSPSFDLSGDRRPGDRSSREDDRYLFLETLWCAKDFLLPQLCGAIHSAGRGNPPSVVINELLDGLDEIADWKDQHGHSIRAVDAVVQRQTLHPYGRDNYLGERLPPILFSSKS